MKLTELPSRRLMPAEAVDDGIRRRASRNALGRNGSCRISLTLWPLPRGGAEKRSDQQDYGKDLEGTMYKCDPNLLTVSKCERLKGPLSFSKL